MLTTGLSFKGTSIINGIPKEVSKKNDLDFYTTLSDTVMRIQDDPNQTVITDLTYTSSDSNKGSYTFKLNLSPEKSGQASAGQILDIVIINSTNTDQIKFVVKNPSLDTDKGDGYYFSGIDLSCNIDNLAQMLQKIINLNGNLRVEGYVTQLQKLISALDSGKPEGEK